MKFIKGFSITSKSLTELLKKHSFSWNGTTQKAFEDLEVALYKASILALSDFTKHFIMKTNAYVTELRAVPNQEARPLAYLNKALCAKHLGLPIYIRMSIWQP